MDKLIELEWIDVDIGGDIHRVLFKGPPLDESLSVRARMEWLSGPGDGLRRLLIEPPHGHPSYCVDMITPAQHPEAQAAFIIMEVMGYPFFSGSNTMATAAALLESGFVSLETTDGEQCVRLETPGGRVDAFATLVDGHVTQVAIQGDEAFVQQADAQVNVPGLGKIGYDLVWSGGHYLLIDAEQVSLTPEEAGQPAGLAIAAQIIEAVQADFNWQHPWLGDVGLPRFLHWLWPANEVAPDRWESIGGTYGHPGVLWGCPTGTGTIARMALLGHRGLAAPGAVLRNTSPSGTAFEATWLTAGQVGEWPSVRARVHGQPTIVGQFSLSVPMNKVLPTTR
ncbi:proline racemase [Spiribacter sp. C176]|uniref:Proline racemase n=1 Tax=Spiribacter salilacus TaxID=2664894 RepID=A0A6N7QNZ7_9GAMM|nr:proline racemase family protein [Spiribacter salilacus]MRH77099.1 proline racemase [Spiribacter salilacus]